MEEMEFLPVLKHKIFRRELKLWEVLLRPQFFFYKTSSSIGQMDTVICLKSSVVCTNTLCNDSSTISSKGKKFCMYSKFVQALFLQSSAFGRMTLFHCGPDPVCSITNAYQNTTASNAGVSLENRRINIISIFNSV